MCIRDSRRCFVQPVHGDQFGQGGVLPRKFPGLVAGQIQKTALQEQVLNARLARQFAGQSHARNDRVSAPGGSVNPLQIESSDLPVRPQRGQGIAEGQICLLYTSRCV